MTKWIMLLSALLMTPAYAVEPVPVSAERLVAFPEKYEGKLVSTIIETTRKLHRDRESKSLRLFDYNTSDLAPLLSVNLAERWLDHFTLNGKFYALVSGTIRVSRFGTRVYLIADNFDLSSASKFVRLQEQR